MADPWALARPLEHKSNTSASSGMIAEIKWNSNSSIKVRAKPFEGCYIYLSVNNFSESGILVFSGFWDIWVMLNFFGWLVIVTALFLWVFLWRVVYWAICIKLIIYSQISMKFHRDLLEGFTQEYLPNFIHMANRLIFQIYYLKHEGNLDSTLQR